MCDGAEPHPIMRRGGRDGHVAAGVHVTKDVPVALLDGPIDKARLPAIIDADNYVAAQRPKKRALLPGEEANDKVDGLERLPDERIGVSNKSPIVPLVPVANVFIVMKQTNVSVLRARVRQFTFRIAVRPRRADALHVGRVGTHPKQKGFCVQEWPCVCASVVLHMCLQESTSVKAWPWGGGAVGTSMCVHQDER